MSDAAAFFMNKQEAWVLYLFCIVVLVLLALIVRSVHGKYRTRNGQVYLRQAEGPSLSRISPRDSDLYYCPNARAWIITSHELAHDLLHPNCALRTTTNVLPSIEETMYDIEKIPRRDDFDVVSLFLQEQVRSVIT